MEHKIYQIDTFTGHNNELSVWEKQQESFFT